MKIDPVPVYLYVALYLVIVIALIVASMFGPKTPFIP